MFQPRVFDHHGPVDLYVDGGLLCNYPINCFDGKWPNTNKLNPMDNIYNTSALIREGVQTCNIWAIAVWLKNKKRDN